MEADRTATRARAGRPRQDDDATDVREGLLDAATRLATERGFDSISIREIAEAAGVTPGMIAYYFGGKGGLYEALIDRVYQRVLTQIRAFLDEPDSAGSDPIARLVDLQVSTFASAPWLPPLVVREVLARDGPFRTFFADRVASGPAQIIPELLQRGITSGRVRDDLDPTLTMLSLMGMVLFPFIAHPLLHEVLGYEINADFRDRLAAHTNAILARGLAPGDAS